MSHHLTTDDWILVATVTTTIYLAAMRWIMPTPKARLRTYLAPLAGCLFLIPNAAMKGYSVSLTLYLYSCGLLMMVITVLPSRKRVAADILKQEQNPSLKVPLNTFTKVWIRVSVIGCSAATIYLWYLLK